MLIVQNGKVIEATIAEFILASNPKRAGDDLLKSLERDGFVKPDKFVPDVFPAISVAKMFKRHAIDNYIENRRSDGEIFMHQQGKVLFRKPVENRRTFECVVHCMEVYIRQLF